MNQWLIGLRVVLKTEVIVTIVGYSCIETFPPQEVKVTVEFPTGQQMTFAEDEFIHEQLGIRRWTANLYGE